MSYITNQSKNYIRVLIVLAAMLAGYIYSTYTISDWRMVFILSFLAIIAETFLVQMPGIGSISVAFAITFAAIILGGPFTGIIVSVTGLLFSRPYVEGRGYIHLFNTPAYKTFFNISQNILYTGLAGLVYHVLHNRFLYLGEIEPISVVGSMSTFVIVNTSLMTLLIITLNGGKVLNIWYENFRGTILSVMAVGFLGIIVAIAYDKYGPGAVVLFFIPLMLSRYSFKLYVDMRKNYYDTVKALINAIEAKDSYTSGHAARVGDILNKTERLSDLEYEVIKSHPAIGYDIISDIGFLKDVMDIVRNHHERWDGKGYPDGLKGSQIPIETCVLTIADSFDAMTTDRPYREALSEQQAIDEIIKYSGTQFNPSIVDVAVSALKKCKVEPKQTKKDKGIA